MSQGGWRVVEQGLEQEVAGPDLQPESGEARPALPEGSSTLQGSASPTQGFPLATPAKVPPPLNTTTLGTKLPTRGPQDKPHPAPAWPLARPHPCGLLAVGTGPAAVPRGAAPAVHTLHGPEPGAEDLGPANKELPSPGE